MKTTTYKIGDFDIEFMAPTIQTQFWIGENDRTIEDMERTRESIRQASTEEHFIAENLNDCGAGKKLYWISGKGGHCDFYAYEGKHFIEIIRPSIWCNSAPSYANAHKLTDEELAQFRAACECELAKFEKRLRTYLKRYGLKHVHVSTYWTER